ncbi:DUF2213 domain-containing protein [Acinetobacter sp. WCHAc060033]|uniref:DUF2213 domain-containing protein n=1 Tax=Acinetobacter sp. WCHAc060033 TaxID=2518624 RepID=UPI0010230748|nr:DUF2213 domain-containing protein [Acinetobacter sp. WCHAc060033]RZG78616.1 DUF2213 domain-containing protein [Acinetobacter sp. WCHAc060033]
MFKKKPKSKATLDRSNFHTTGHIGRTRETTPEGYLLCRDVPIARLGKLMYGDGEVPVTADDKGLIIIERDEDALFNPQTIASFEGKPVTDDHPDDWVSPENHKELSNGTAHDVRRGEGVESDYLMADLLITDKDTIDAVMGGKVEISLGYDADYTEIGVGKGIQTNIFGNHIALVDKGRCGSRCSIGDSFMSKKKVSFADRIRNLVKTKDADEAEKLAKAVEDEAPDIKTEDDDNPEDESSTQTGDAAFQAEMRKFMKTMDKRMTAIEKKKTKDSESEEEKTEDSDDEESETKDDVLNAEKTDKLSENGVQNHTGDSLKQVLSRAEILAPGIKLPTTDSANNGKAVLAAKRMTLKQAHATTDGQNAIAPFIGTYTDFDTMPVATIDAAFIGASELIKQKNNTAGVRSGISTRDFGRAPATPADINARNREFWNKG